MNITVYLGSAFGNDTKYEKAVQELGTWIGFNSHKLIYGGSKSGLMGVLADSAVKAGGYVIGIEVQMFIDSQVQHEGINELIVTDGFQERKQKMYTMGDAFIAVPGGVGTLDEIAEVISQSALGRIKGPCIFFNYDGFYDFTKKQLDVMDNAGFLKGKDLSNVYFASSIEEIADILSRY